jgi:hypothetical protein
MRKQKEGTASRFQLDARRSSPKIWINPIRIQDSDRHSKTAGRPENRSRGHPPRQNVLPPIFCLNSE